MSYFPALVTSLRRCSPAISDNRVTIWGDHTPSNLVQSWQIGAILLEIWAASRWQGQPNVKYAVDKFANFWTFHPGAGGQNFEGRKKTGIVWAGNWNAVSPVRRVGTMGCGKRKIRCFHTTAHHTIPYCAKPSKPISYYSVPISGEHLCQIYRRLIGRLYIALARQEKIYRNI